LEASLRSGDDGILLDVPPHVDAELVVDFDYMNPPGIEAGDVYKALARLHRGPDIVWTPRHGGHWIATRGEDIQWIQESWQIFSNTEKGVPKGRCPFMPPITFDPPDHSRYRAVFNPYFARRKVEEQYQPLAREVIVELIEGLRPKGSCEFVAEFAFIAPLRVFWGIVDLPYEQREKFLAWGRAMAGYATDEQRREAHSSITAYLGELLDLRLKNPGNDIFTGISQWRNNPRYQRREELIGMAELVFLGGQDTVASQMGFAMLRLAEQPELQQRLKDTPAIIPGAVEELLRRHGLSNTGRLIMQDVERKGARLKQGDMMMVVNGLSGIDERMYPDPFHVDFDRGPVHYNSFGNGPHICVGAPLARMELRVMLEEWSRRMPIARLDPGKPPPASHAGPVNGMTHLHLVWDR
jgi:cytochrome P450